MKSNVDLYLTSDKSRVVTADDPEASMLLVNAGREIPEAEVRKFVGAANADGVIAGFNEANAPAEDEPKAPKRAAGKPKAAPKDKSVKAPEGDKAATGDGDKAPEGGDRKAELDGMSDDELARMAPEGFSGNRDELVEAILAGESAEGK